MRTGHYVPWLTVLILLGLLGAKFKTPDPYEIRLEALRLSVEYYSDPWFAGCDGPTGLAEKFVEFLNTGKVESQ